LHESPLRRSRTAEHTTGGRQRVSVEIAAIVAELRNIVGDRNPLFGEDDRMLAYGHDEVAADTPIFLRRWPAGPAAQVSAVLPGQPRVVP
jgi:hypothetical protein